VLQSGRINIAPKDNIIRRVFGRKTIKCGSGSRPRLGNLSTKRRVAIVDDEPSVLRGLKRVLDASDFTAEVFNSAEAFLDRGSASDVTCTVLDINMGGISGIEMQRRLKAMGSTTPVIFMTALDTMEVRREAMDAGCAAFLQKPFSAHELINSIRNATSFI
jgi:FixJ family two-component response regulator